MSERLNLPNRAWLLVLAMAAGGLPLQSSQGGDSLADPERLETALDERRVTEDIRVGYFLGRFQFKPLERIPLFVQAKNVSDRTIYGSSTGDLPISFYRTFRLRVFDSNGELVPKTRYHTIDVKYRGFPVGGGLGIIGQYQPGQVTMGEVFPNLVYDMTSPGRYTILIEFPTRRTETIDGETVPIVGQSEPIELEVVPEPAQVYQFDQIEDQS